MQRPVQVCLVCAEWSLSNIFADSLDDLISKTFSIHAMIVCKLAPKAKDTRIYLFDWVRQRFIPMQYLSAYLWVIKWLTTYLWVLKWVPTYLWVLKWVPTYLWVLKWVPTYLWVLKWVPTYLWVLKWVPIYLWVLKWVPIYLCTEKIT